MNKIVCLILYCLTALANAEEAVKIGDRLDIVLKDGTRYDASKISDISDEKILIINKAGVFTVQKSDLSPDTQAKFGWSDAIGQKIQDEKIKAERIQQAKIAIDELTIKASFHITQVLPDGILASGSGYYGRPIEEITKIEAKHETKTDVFTETVASLDGPKVVTRTRSYQVLVEPARTETNTRLKRYSFDNLVFVEMNTDGLVDDSDWSGLVWEAGTYSYTAVSNARKTIRKYTTLPPENIRKLLNETKQ